MLTEASVKLVWLSGSLLFPHPDLLPHLRGIYSLFLSGEGGADTERGTKIDRGREEDRVRERERDIHTCKEIDNSHKKKSVRNVMERGGGREYNYERCIKEEIERKKEKVKGRKRTAPENEKGREVLLYLSFIHPLVYSGQTPPSVTREAPRCPLIV